MLEFSTGAVTARRKRYFAYASWLFRPIWVLACEACDLIWVTFQTNNMGQPVNSDFLLH